MRYSLIIPTLNAARELPALLESIRFQTLCPHEILIMDSSSSDETAFIARQEGGRVVPVARESFDHGGTRQLAADLAQGEILIFLTQDVVFGDNDALEKLVSPFSDPTVGAVCGQQRPKKDADPLAACARHYNYPLGSCIKSFDDIPDMGIKAAFLSNSFAAYRKCILQAVGGFPAPVVFGEDMVTAARMVLSGYRVAYQGAACVLHSHNYTAWQTFRRYFDIGSLHAREPWIQEQFGCAQGEGWRYVRSEMKYVRQFGWKWVLRSALFSAAKFVGYKLGKIEAQIPVKIKRNLSMNSNFW